MRRAIAFLTPFGPASVPDPGALDWFPVVGAAIGLAVGGAWWLATKAWPPIAAAAVVVVVDVALTGYLHLDGLADAADGLLPPMPRERRLEVMADPAVGAFGAVTLLGVVVLRFAALASSVALPLVVGALWCGSRTAMAIVARTVHYARPGGLASAFVDPPTPEPSGGPGSGGLSESSESSERLDVRGGVVRGGAARGGAARGGAVRVAAVPAVIGGVLTIGMAFAGRGVHGLAAVGAEVIGVSAVVVLARRRIGGFTGDVLGAAGVVGETLGLLVLAAKW